MVKREKEKADMVKKREKDRLKCLLGLQGILGQKYVWKMKK